jgi:hypothetical protein
VFICLIESNYLTVTPLGNLKSLTALQLCEGARQQQHQDLPAKFIQATPLDWLIADRACKI